MNRLGLAIGFLAGLAALPVQAQRPPAWPAIAAQAWSGAEMRSASDLIVISAPTRTMDDLRTRIGARIEAPEGDALTRVTLVMDKNPMPVSAVLDLALPQPSFAFDVTMRVNGPTPVHVVVETAMGEMFVAETYMKTSGTGACAAAPATDSALATLGEMEVGMTYGVAEERGSDALPAARSRRVGLDIRHPGYSGMQRDQVSLLYIPARYIERIAIALDGRSAVTVTGSISLSEDPGLSVTLPGAARAVSVEMTDTDGTVTRAEGGLAGL